ncbi:MAG: hypothetical protein ACSHX8_12365 [Opitutaceae bacterium]
MNKFYDKLLLVLAICVLLAGVAFYVVKSGAAPSANPQVSTETAQNPYQSVPVPVTSNDQEATWPEPVEQSIHTEGEVEGWVYDVFTPPKIYIDAEGRFSAEGVKPPPPPVPFGVYLAGIERNPYRIQIEGYIEEVPGDASKSLLLMYDEERAKSIRVRVDAAVAESEFKVLSFTIERIVDPVEGIYKEAKATILDQRDGKEVVLTQGERLYDDTVTIQIASHEDPSVDIQLAEVGQTFETNLGQYVLKEINLEESSISVEKLGNDEREAETERLDVDTSASKDSTDQSTISPPDNTSSDGNDLEDLMF